jgi:hypothetical protein
MGIDSGNCAIARHAIPKISFSTARTERFRDPTLKISPRDPSTSVRDDRQRTAKKRLAGEGAAVHSATQN